MYTVSVFEGSKASAADRAVCFFARSGRSTACTNSGEHTANAVVTGPGQCSELTPECVTRFERVSELHHAAQVVIIPAAQ